MTGRYSGIDDGTENHPVARFGHVAALPIELQHDRYRHPTYLVEMRSINQYSGSPVFSYIPKQELLADTDREEARKSTEVGVLDDMQGVAMVLGVDVGHKGEELSGYLVGNSVDGVGVRVNVNSAMALVTPAEYIVELLETPDAKASRDLEEQQLIRRIDESDIVHDRQPETDET
jgi:hypothetical protein